MENQFRTREPLMNPTKSNPCLPRVLGAAALGVLLSTHGHAAALAVANPSFESPAQAAGGFTASIPGWTIATPHAGVQNIPLLFLTPVPDGQQVACINMAGSVYQTLTNKLEAGMSYTLTVAIGRRTDMTAPPPGGFAVQLCAGDHVLGLANPPAPPAGRFVTAEVNYATPEGDSRLGLPLRIVLSKANTISGEQLVFDHVRLDAAYNAAWLAIRPNGGEFTNAVDVTLTSLISRAVIRYTLDGSEPVTTSEGYQNPLTLAESRNVRARLFVGSAPASEVYSATFTRLSDIAFAPAPGLFTNAVDVVLRNTLPVGTTRYTLDGTDPTLSSPVYASPIRLTAAATIKARIWLNGFPISTVHTANYLRVYAVNDGVPNAWRERYFGPGYLTDPRVGALEDPDHDGVTNMQEYTAGSDPLDPLSGFAVGIQAVPQVSWVSVPERVYRILRKSALDDPEWTVVVPDFKAAGTNSTYVDTAVAGRRAFYTVQPAGP
jgi:hypothetical protein